MSELLVSELLRFCKDTYGVDLRHAGGARNLWHVEWCLLKVLVQVGRAVMTQWFKEVTTTGKQDRPRTIERDGVRYRFVGYRAKTLHGLFGAVTYQRAYYASGSGQGLAPLDERLGIKRQHTPGCQYFLSMFVAHQAHAEGCGSFTRCSVRAGGSCCR